MRVSFPIYVKDAYFKTNWQILALLRVIRFMSLVGTFLALFTSILFLLRWLYVLCESNTFLSWKFLFYHKIYIFYDPYKKIWVSVFSVLRRMHAEGKQCSMASSGNKRTMGRSWIWQILRERRVKSKRNKTQEWTEISLGSVLPFDKQESTLD